MSLHTGKNILPQLCIVCVAPKRIVLNPSALKLYFKRQGLQQSKILFSLENSESVRKQGRKKITYFGPGGALLYIGYAGMCRPIGQGFCAVLVWNRVWFLRELRECMNELSFQFQMSTKEREIYEFEMAWKTFCLHSNLSNNNIISA